MKSPTSTTDGIPVIDRTEDPGPGMHAGFELQNDAEVRLRQKEAEFQDFILGAVHELREPLRAVNAYCELLSKTNAGSGDEEADRFRGYILSGTAKIQALLSGMVDYAAAGSADGYIFRVDVNDVLRSAESTAASSGRQLRVTHGPLPSVRGDFEKLVKIFRHLLENAAQYCEAAEARIHVTAERDGSDWLFAVQDNGPGIDASYHRRIFAPFKRLHGKQIPGLGLGLAFCHRAVESQGGRIWVESTPGGGSIFCFTLPADD